MANYTISGIYTLPSLGKIYGEGINPTFTIRSMTTNEEMRRQNPSDRPYKVLADIIDDCLVDKPGISSYDVCFGDFQFLLHKLRIITYGSDCKIASVCPYCGEENSGSINLGQLQVHTYTDDLQKYFEFDLPVTKKHIKIRLQTPRMLDEIELRNKDLKKKSSGASGDSAFLLNLETIVQTIDGTYPDPISKTEFLRNLPMADTNTILVYSSKLNDSIGIDTLLHIDCESCGLDYTSRFRTTTEFFRPSVDI
ncbi:MAG: hypothetical protein J6S67_19860 [Methanobrevibacter sp.]|nr:hypothetical protein [Methanobrevibacter sp.]